ncbi:MAG: hypothetical protein ACJAT3_001312 [Akkermansiaceae bacterium]|jgi:hypothetical protein
MAWGGVGSAARKLIARKIAIRVRAVGFMGKLRGGVCISF